MSPVSQKAREEGREETIGSHFYRLDTNRDLAASQNGFLAGTEETAAVSRRAFRENDRNEDDKLDTNEFLQASGELKKECIELEFRETDRDRDGFRDTREWRHAVSAVNREDLEDLEDPENLSWSRFATQTVTAMINLASPNSAQRGWLAECASAADVTRSRSILHGSMRIETLTSASMNLLPSLKASAHPWSVARARAREKARKGVIAKKRQSWRS